MEHVNHQIKHRRTEETTSNNRDTNNTQNRDYGLKAGCFGYQNSLDARY
jgi:hypothetical protein